MYTPKKHSLIYIKKKKMEEKKSKHIYLFAQHLPAGNGNLASKCSELHSPTDINLGGWEAEFDT